MRIEYQKDEITITHQIDKTQHHFMVVISVKLTSIEVDRIKMAMKLS